jgi:hypothetical protein
VKDWFDDRHNNESSPDPLLTNGTDDLAIEIKQLTDGKCFDKHDRAQQSLYRRLAPDAVGHYALLPPPSLRLPLDRSLLKKLKPQVAIAATDLQPGGSAIVLVPRQATLRLVGPSQVGLVMCLHPRGDEVRAVSPDVTGFYFLEDGGPDHQFLSEECRLSFHQALKRACEESKRSGQAEVEWFEEWKLTRTEDSAEGAGGMLVVAAVGDFPEAAVIESVDKAICGARKKFKAQKWAGRSAAALHAGEQQHELSPALFRSALERLNPADVKPLDIVFFVSGEDVRQFNFLR